MLPNYILFLLTLMVFLTSEKAFAQQSLSSSTSANNFYSNQYSNNQFTYGYGSNQTSSTSSNNSSWIPQSLSNMLPNSSQNYNSSISQFGNSLNIFQSGLFNGSNYYIYPASGNSPDKLIANNDGTYYLYPASGTQPQKVMPSGNNDGSYNIYPPGYNPSTSSNNNSQANNINFQPERVVPTNNGGYYIYSPFGGQPDQVTANNDGTYYIYPPTGGNPDKIVPMGSGQSTSNTAGQNSSQIQMPTTSP